MPEEFIMNILDIQPSQLYISEKKLKIASEWLNDNSRNMYEPIPIKKLNGKIIFTDGHTRAFVLYNRGVEDIRCIWDEDELDWDLYQICVDWCLDDGIHNISHLAHRVVNHDAYQTLWYERCAKLNSEQNISDKSL